MFLSFYREIISRHFLKHHLIINQVFDKMIIIFRICHLQIEILKFKTQVGSS